MRLGSWYDVAFGFVLGFAFAALVVVWMTDIDAPVANEPKCETIIIHRR